MGVAGLAVHAATGLFILSQLSRVIMGQNKAFKPERNDVLEAGRAPDSYRRFLTQIGGTNPYGEPNYRLVVAEYVMIHRGNNWYDWPKNTKLKDQGGLVFSD